MGLFGQLSLQAVQLLDSRGKVGPALIQLYGSLTVSYSEGRLPPWKQECFQYIDI